MMAALAALVALAPALAEAKMGGSGSMGSRGSRSYSAPPSTRTAPGAASPFERSITQQPSINPGAASRPMGTGGFGRGLMGGLAAGLLGAGLFGLLTGHGFFGGMGGFASVIGLLLQLALVVFLARLAFNWFANRNAAAAGGRPSPNSAAFTGGPAGVAAGLRALAAARRRGRAAAR